MTERRAFQTLLCLAACVPVFGGLLGILHGLDAATVNEDSHVRYLSGLLLGIGLAFWSCAFKPETKGARFRLLTLIVVTGGLARLLHAIIGGFYGPATLLPLLMELVITPVMATWQTRIARGILDA